MISPEGRVGRLLSRLWSRVLISSLARELAASGCAHDGTSPYCSVCVLVVMHGGVFPTIPTHDVAPRAGS